MLEFSTTKISEDNRVNGKELGALARCACLETRQEDHKFKASLNLKMKTLSKQTKWKTIVFSKENLSQNHLTLYCIFTVKTIKSF